MWQTASQLKIRAARGYGATVDDSAPDIPSAFERLDELVESTGRQLIHPYDDPLVMAGQGTVGLEIVEDAPAPPTSFSFRSAGEDWSRGLPPRSGHCS